jgi:hypothetical protein
LNGDPGMPTSQYRVISSILDKIRVVHRSKPIESVLDVGIGFGKYGYLIRELLDIRFKRYEKKSWLTRIDGVEIFPNYITLCHEYIYNKIYYGDIYGVSSTLDNYDLVLLFEVLEHMPKERGKKVIKELYKRTNKLFMCSFPDHFKGGEGADWTNKYEEHKCLWIKQDVEDIVGELFTLDINVYVKVKK